MRLLELRREINNMKKFLVCLMCCFGIFTLCSATSTVGDVYLNEFDIFVNGEYYSPNLPILNYQGRTYLPLNEFGSITSNSVNFSNNSIYVVPNDKDLFYIYKYLDDARDNITTMNECISQAMGDYLDTFYSGTGKDAAKSFLKAYNNAETKNSNLMNTKTTFTNLCLRQNILNQYSINEFYSDMDKLHEEYNDLERKISNGLNSNKLVDVTSTYGDALDILFDLQGQIDGLKKQIYNTIYDL